MVIACIISFVVGALIMMCTIGIVAYQKDKKPLNNCISMWQEIKMEDFIFILVNL